MADLVTDADLEMGSLYPPLEMIQDCSIKIAEKVVEYAYEKELATFRPQPKDTVKFIKAQMYDVSYKSAIPALYPKL